jgi:hypothetical protein
VEASGEECTVVYPDGDDDLWRKSTYSGAAGACVEVAVGNDAVLMRDSKDADGPRLGWDRAAWAAFIAGVHKSEFDRPDRY